MQFARLERTGALASPHDVVLKTGTRLDSIEGGVVRLSDGESFVFWEDEAELLREIARFSKRDAEAYPVYDAMMERACQVMDQFILGPPPSFAEFAAAFDQPGDEKVFKMVILGSVADLAEYYFESDIMQGSTCARRLIW